jgi:hypothetical protein
VAFAPAASAHAVGQPYNLYYYETGVPFVNVWCEYAGNQIDQLYSGGFGYKIAETTASRAGGFCASDFNVPAGWLTTSYTAYWYNGSSWQVCGTGSRNNTSTTWTLTYASPDLGTEGNCGYGSYYATTHHEACWASGQCRGFDLGTTTHNPHA